MEYYDPNNRTPVRWAAIAVLLYFTLFTLLLIFVRFSTEPTEEMVEGILVEFGDDNFGDGDEELVATDITEAPIPESVEEQPEEILTDPNSEVEVEIPQPEEPKVVEEKVPEERVVNQNALFPGRKEQSTATSQGDSQESGNQGAESGGESGVSQGGGDGNTPIAVLKDRSVVGSLPRPAYNADASGRVIIDITVDEQGRVQSAAYRAQGSTTNNSQLVAAARAAALKARFTPSDNFIQGGTITYIFKMN
ncbi:MAG: TonB family protein [Rikenellaceae bacterium]